MTIAYAVFRDSRLSREFWAKTYLNPDTHCWVWVSRTSRTGTPMHGAKVAWRFAHERLLGPLIRGSQGKRACEEPLCVNPAHRIVERPKTCASCGQALPDDGKTSEVLALADGKVAVQVVDRNDEPQVHEDLSNEYHLPVREGRVRKTSWSEIDGALGPIQRNPLPLGDPTGRWERSGDTRKVEFAGGRIREWGELTDEQRSAFSRMRGKQRLEPGTFGREIEDAMGEFD